MILYMVRDKNTGLFYKRRNEWIEGMVGASIWTTIHGARNVIGSINGNNKRWKDLHWYKEIDPEIITLTAET